VGKIPNSPNCFSSLISYSVPIFDAGGICLAPRPISEMAAGPASHQLDPSGFSKTAALKDSGPSDLPGMTLE
jgi:hypothetical protein